MGARKKEEWDKFLSFWDSPRNRREFLNHFVHYLFIFIYSYSYCIM